MQKNKKIEDTITPLLKSLKEVRPQQALQDIIIQYYQLKRMYSHHTRHKHHFDQTNQNPSSRFKNVIHVAITTLPYTN